MSRKKLDANGLALELLTGATVRVRTFVDGGWVWSYRYIRLKKSRPWSRRRPHHKVPQRYRRKRLLNGKFYRRRIPGSKHRVHAPWLRVIVRSESKLLLMQAVCAVRSHIRATRARVISGEVYQRRARNRWGYSGRVMHNEHAGDHYWWGVCIAYRGISARSLAMRGVWMRKRCGEVRAAA